MSRVFIKQAIVSIDEIDEKDVRCPSCGDSRALKLDGYVMIPKTIIVEGDDISEESFHDDTSYKLTKLLCMVCGTNHSIQDQNVFELQKSNIKMNEIIRETTGRDLLKLGPIC